MTWTRWTPCPPQFVHRRAVQGVKPTGDRATTIFDLRHDREHVAVYPATVDTFALLIDRAGVEALLAALESRTTCAVRGIHATHGRQLLGLRVCDRPHAEFPLIGPLPDARSGGGLVELSVNLPGADVRILYGPEQCVILRDVLAQILGLMR